MVAIRGDECGWHKKVVLRPVHPDRRTPHQYTGDGKRVFERRRDTELFDEVERFKAMAPVADEMPGLADSGGALDLAADGAHKVTGLLAVHEIPAADQASCRMLHIVRCATIRNKLVYTPTPPLRKLVHTHRRSPMRLQSGSDLGTP
jgi:hypothetical protein